MTFVRIPSQHVQVMVNVTGGDGYAEESDRSPLHFDPDLTGGSSLFAATSDHADIISSGSSSCALE